METIGIKIPYLLPPTEIITEWKKIERNTSNGRKGVKTRRRLEIAMKISF